MASRRLCNIADVDPHGTEVTVEEAMAKHFLMLFRREDRVVGYHNVCPHQGYGLNVAPGRFHFTPEGWLMCAHHGASFEVDSGRCVEGPCRGAALQPVQLELRGEEIWLVDPVA